MRRILWAAGLAIGSAVTAAAMAVALAVVVAAPAGAELTGPCEARGTFVAGEDADPDSPQGPVEVDAKTATGVIEIPDSGSVDWQGQIGDGQPTEPRRTGGNVVITMPPVFDTIFGDLVSLTEVETWGGDDETSTFEFGVEEYDIPGYVPGGAVVVVAGGHSDTLGSCAGSVRLRIPGSPLDSPVTVVVLVLTGGTVITMVLAGVQRPV